MFTITTTSTGLASIIFFVLGLTLYTFWKKEKTSEELKFFAIFLFSFGFQQAFFSLGSGLVADNKAMSNLFWAIAHLFMFVGISYLLRFSIRAKYPALEKKVFIITLIASAVGETILMLNRGAVQPFLLDNGIYNWKVPQLSGATIGIFTVSCLLFSFWIFISNIKKLPTRVLRFRSLTMAIAILMFFVGGPIHNFVTTPLVNFMADGLLVSSVVVMAVGIYIPRIVIYLNEDTSSDKA
ncbi:MAG: hypothetical protein Q7S70_01310 [bacterium]|nr:hypothetical protein [bacterium]